MSDGAHNGMTQTEQHYSSTTSPTPTLHQTGPDPPPPGASALVWLPRPSTSISPPPVGPCDASGTALPTYRPRVRAAQDAVGGIRVVTGGWW